MGQHSFHLSAHLRRLKLERLPLRRHQRTTDDRLEHSGFCQHHLGLPGLHLLRQGLKKQRGGIPKFILGVSLGLQLVKNDPSQADLDRQQVRAFLP